MATRTRPRKPGPRGGRDSLGEAQELIYQAWEIPNLKTTWLEKALAISPDCADAFVLLAEAATSPSKTLELYRRGVQAGERALGQQPFAEDVVFSGHILETRPYMRARAWIRPISWDCGEYDEALTHWRDMLRLI